MRNFTFQFQVHNTDNNNLIFIIFKKSAFLKFTLMILANFGEDKIN